MQMNVLHNDSYGAIFIKLYPTVTLSTNIFMFLILSNGFIL